MLQIAFLHVRRFSVLLLFFGVLGLFVGCGEGNTDSAAGEWSIEDGALTLERELLVGDDEAFFFGRIYDVAVRNDGRIYVADGEASHVKVLSPDGTLQDSIGRAGQGPGEFRRPSEVVLARGDSIYVLDGYWGRVSVFGPEGDFEYSFTPREEMGSPRNMMIPTEGDRFFFAYSPGSRTIVKTDAGYAVRVARRSGEVGDTLFTARPPRWPGRSSIGGCCLRPFRSDGSRSLVWVPWATSTTHGAIVFACERTTKMGRSSRRSKFRLTGSR